METAIIGYSGSGKSVLANYLSGLYGPPPALYLDKVEFVENWKFCDQEQLDAFMRSAAER